MHPFAANGSDHLGLCARQAVQADVVKGNRSKRKMRLTKWLMHRKDFVPPEDASTRAGETQNLRLVFPPPSWQRHCLPLRSRHCLRLVFPPPSCVAKTLPSLAVKTLPSPCLSTAFVAKTLLSLAVKTLPSPCLSTAFVAKTLPFFAVKTLPSWLRHSLSLRSRHCLRG